MRVRAFTQDDAHIFCAEEQITDECRIVCQLILDIYSEFGFDDVRSSFQTGRRNALALMRIGINPKPPSNLRSKRRGLKIQSTPAKERFTVPSWNSCCAMPLAETGSAARCRWI